jgi:hypothetical protein
MSLPALTAGADVLFGGLDGVRRRLLRAAVGVRWLRTSIVRRDARLCAQSVLSVLLLGMATLLLPGLLLVAGPVLFGVAHVTGDVRHLVVRRNVPRPWMWVIAVACASLVALRVAELVAPSALPFASVEVLTGWGWVAAGIALGAFYARSVARGLLVAAPVAFVAVLSAHSPSLARSVFAYVHNLVALVVWVALFRGRRLVALPAIAGALAIATLFASGTLVPWTHWQGPWTDRVVVESMAQVGVGVAPQVAVGIGLSYVFLQAIHYAVWIAWIPQDDLRARGTATFRMTARALRRELGDVGVGMVVVAAAVVVVASLVRTHPTRAVYLSVAAFHGWLELAALGFFAARGQVGRALPDAAGWMSPRAHLLK